MGNNGIKELIIQKQEKYDEIIDEKKKQFIKHSVAMAICSVVAFVFSDLGLRTTSNLALQAVYAFVTGASGLGAIEQVVSMWKRLNEKYKFEIKKEQLDELLKEINGEEKGKTL